MKILTTAAFSVLLLRRKLSSTKWLALLFLALGVGIVQIQNGSSQAATAIHHDMNAIKGFMAVVAACFTSGLAGVYFEMVLKNSQGDLWVRNVQLSLFSLLPALAAIVFSGPSSAASGPLGWFDTNIFANFTAWAWATVFIQVLGGLLTALVIKYADNILKGFATSLSIVISFMASVVLFDFRMTITFVLGSTIVLVATWMYNQPDVSSVTTGSSNHERSWSWSWKGQSANVSRALPVELSASTLSRRASTSSLNSVASFAAPVQSKSYPPSPTERDTPSLNYDKSDKNSGKQNHLFSSFAPLKATRLFASRIGLERSASFGGAGVPEHGYAAYPLSHAQPASASSSYPPSRPASAMSSFPSSVASSTLSESRSS